MLIQYHCFKCGDRFDILWRNSKEVQNTAICSCGAKAKREYGCQVIIDDWSPEGKGDNFDAQRDIDHFEKKKSRGETTMYREDRMKQGIPMNL